MKRKETPVAPEATEEPVLKEHFPDATAEKRFPSKEEFKARVLALDNAGEREAAAELLRWYEEKKRKRPESKLVKATKITAFTLAVLTGILGFLWFSWLQEGGNRNTSLVVCSVGGEILQGEDCFKDPQELKPKPSSEPGGLLED